MKAIASFFITGIVMVLLICGVTSCIANSKKTEQRNEKKELQEQVKELNSECISLRNENANLRNEMALKDIQISSYERGDIANTQLVTLYSTMFALDPNGKFYSAGEEQLWYTNPYCTDVDSIKGEDVILLSSTIIEWVLPNGNTVYTCRTNQNVIVYTTTKPYLSEITN